MGKYFFDGIEEKLENKKYNSIDACFNELWLESKSKIYASINKTDLVYGVIEYCKPQLLKILKSKTNKPSKKYDPKIILILNEHMSETGAWTDLEYEILTIYNDRKIKSKYYTSKSLEEFVNFIKSSNVNEYDELIEYIVGRHLQRIIDILQLKTNKPSKYDLEIIQYINTIKNPTDLPGKILELYKNRKADNVNNPL